VPPATALWTKSGASHGKRHVCRKKLVGSPDTLSALDFAFLLFLIIVGLGLVGLILFAIWRLASTAATSPAREVALDYEVPWKVGTTLDYLAERASPILEDAGYSTERDPSELRYSSTHRRVWLIVLIILFFPISLLLLLAVTLLALAGGYRGQLFSNRDQLTMKVSPLDPGSRVTVVGRMPPDQQGQMTELLAGIGKRRASAGWYEEAAGIERYWDGEDWTEQTRRTIDRPIVVGPRMQHAQATERQQTKQ
jgi:hypothetical protein